jgi:Flp pilus assembly protein TadB
MHKLCAAQIVAILGFSFEISLFSQILLALTSRWAVNMLRAARKGLAERPGFFDQAAPKT